MGYSVNAIPNTAHEVTRPGPEAESKPQASSSLIGGIMSKTLLQLMLENEMEWPSGALFAAQDGDDSNVFWYMDAPYKSAPKNRAWRCRIWNFGSAKKLRELASDYRTKIIDKSEYLLAGGWMDYDGSGSPAQAGIIKAGTLVEVAWDDESTTQFREGDGSGVAWIGGSPRILRYRILVDETPINEPDPAATEQASKEAESTCTILMMSGEVHYGARVTYQSDQTVVWECDGVEHASKAEYVKIGPPRDALASSALHRLCRVSVAPSIMLELMNEMGWK